MRLMDSFFSVVERADEACVTVRFHADHPIYRAHFPGNPITPGVCILKMIAELLELQGQKRLRLAVVKNLKFAAPIIPTDVPTVTIRFDKRTETETGIHVKGVVVQGEQVYTKFSLVYQYV